MCWMFNCFFSPNSYLTLNSLLQQCKHGFEEAVSYGNRGVTYSITQSCQGHRERQMIIIVIIIIMIIFISCMRGIDNYISETNHVSRVFSVAIILYLQFGLHVTLFRL